MAFWELEETVGRCWHRLVGAAESYPQHPQAAVSLAPLRARLGVFYRGLGGAGGVRLTTASLVASRHRLTFRQRLGLGAEESLEQPTFDGENLLLPERLACFPEREHNEQLYYWLAAFFAHAPAATPPYSDPLAADLDTLRRIQATTRNTLARWPGLAASHANLAAAVRAIRPVRTLTVIETAVEAVILHLLGGAVPASAAGREFLELVMNDADLGSQHAPRGYRPFLPVPLWGEVVPMQRAPNTADSETPGGGGAPATEKRLKAKRRPTDQAQRRDSLLLYRFEHIPMLADMANVNRHVEDDDLDAARRAAESLDEITVGSHDGAAATRLKLDLELAPAAIDTTVLSAEHAYPEWDYTRQSYHRDHCRVLAQVATEEGIDWQPDASARRRIRVVRRQFEALRPRRETFTAQPDGDDLDLNALVRSYAEIQAGGTGSDRVYVQVRDAQRDLAVAILVDASLSTDSWVDNRRVLDVEKEAVLALSHGLTACGDDHAVFAFTSRKRHNVSVHTLKDFDKPLNSRVRRRVEALKPGYYTRMGAALRHVSAQLRERLNRHRLVLLLTDGKPNDMDYYEGRYGVEDTRRAIREARREGLAVFGITVDSQARDYFPYLFGRGAYAIVGRIGRLPSALPAIYRQITG
jgi:nitric oxide reductase NorD protein